MSAIRRTIVGALGILLLATGAPVAATAFPSEIPLPTGFQPEGIATGKGTSFFVGSVATGAIYRGNLRTGEGDVLVPGGVGRSALGLEVDRKGRLFVAGGPTGQAYVFDARSGDELATFQLTSEVETFVNDVALTKDSAWFTDSFRPVLYRVPLGRPGRLPAPDEAEELSLSGDFVLQDGFNLNGIAAARTGALVAVQSNTGALFSIDPATGMTTEIPIDGGDLAFGDGILLHGRTLYVVQNQLNRVAVVRLATDLASGEIVDHLTDPALDIPTTIADFGRWLYAVNARFRIEDPETADYHVIRLAK